MHLLNLPNKLNSVSLASELTSFYCNDRKPIPMQYYHIIYAAVKHYAKFTINAFNYNTIKFAR